MARLIDTHFHLDHYKNYLEIATQISELKQYTICVTNSPGIFLSCKNIIRETQYLKFGIGFHPLEDSLGIKDLKDFLFLLKLSNYVGEIGLDYSGKSKMNKGTQTRVFETIVEKCTSENKLMTIHIRKAETDAIEIIKKYSPEKCIIHWFTGNKKQMIELLDLGCYFSINTNMITTQKRNMFFDIPSNRILIESDGPFTKVGRKRYTPDQLNQAYKLISDFFELPNLETIVYSNFQAILDK